MKQHLHTFQSFLLEGKQQREEQQLIAKFKAWVGNNTPTSIDIDFYSHKHNLSQDKKALLKRTFLSDDIKIRSTGPTPDVRFRFEE